MSVGPWMSLIYLFIYLLGLLGLIAEFGQYVAHDKVMFASPPPNHERELREKVMPNIFRIHQQMQNLSTKKFAGGILCSSPVPDAL